MITIQWVGLLVVFHFFRSSGGHTPAIFTIGLFPGEEAGLEASYPQTGGEGAFNV